MELRQCERYDSFLVLIYQMVDETSQVWRDGFRCPMHVLGSVSHQTCSVVLLSRCLNYFQLE